MREARIIVSFYDERGYSAIEPGIIPHFNSKCTRYFEGTVQQIAHQHRCHVKCDYFGILSWRTWEKTGHSPSQIKHAIELDCDTPDYYWVKLHGMPSKLNPWKQGESCHPGLFEAAEKVVFAAGLDSDFLNREANAVFCHYFILKPACFDVFMEEAMNPCIQVMNDPLFDSLLVRQTPYEGSRLANDKLVQIFGVPYFTMHPFIVERLFPSFAAARAWRGKKIP
jgi:hypothetical protein